MVLAPHHKVLNEDNETDEEFIKFRKESSSKKGIVHSIKLERKKTHQGEIRFWKSIKLWEKRVGHQARKDFNQKKKKKKRKKWMQEFSSSCERILIHQKTQETWDSMKAHSSWEGWAKMKIHQKQNSIIEEDEKKKR